jgi:DNA-binding beta-propeller fold protein YncE
MTINDQGEYAQLFVSNVLSGTVTRIDLSIPDGSTPAVVSEMQIGSGFAHEIVQAELALGPTGLAFDPRRDVLYVASTLDNKIFAISNAADRTRDTGTGRVIYQDNTHLHGPLGLVLAPNGDLIAANGDGFNADPNQPSELVEFTPNGQFVGQFSINSSPDAPFGLALSNVGGVLRLASVDDDQNTLDIWTFHTNHKSSFSSDDSVLGSPDQGTGLTSVGAGSPSQMGALPGGPLALTGSPAGKSPWRWWA